MEVTKNDLSGGLAKLDFEALLTTSQVAVGELCEKVTKCLGEIRGNRISNSITNLHLNASWLRGYSVNLEIAAETLATLMGAMEGREIEIVNFSDKSVTTENPKKGGKYNGRKRN